MSIRLKKDEKGADHFQVDGREGLGLALGMALDLRDLSESPLTNVIVLTPQRRQVLGVALRMYCKVVALESREREAETDANDSASSPSEPAP